MSIHTPEPAFFLRIGLDATFLFFFTLAALLGGFFADDASCELITVTKGAGSSEGKNAQSLPKELLNFFLHVSSIGGCFLL